MSLLPHIQGRIEDLGLLGGVLSEFLPMKSSEIFNYTYVDQVMYFEKIKNKYKKIIKIQNSSFFNDSIERIFSIELSELLDPKKIKKILKKYKKIKLIQTLHLLAISLLLVKASIQFEIEESIAIELFDSTIHRLGETSKPLNMEKEKELKFYGVKFEKGEGMKTNIYFSDIYKSIKKSHPHIANEYVRLSCHTSSFSNDQASCCLIWALANYNSFGLKSVELAIRLILFPDDTKVLTIVLKSSGNNSSLLYARFTEAHCLQGMSEYDGDLREKIIKRCNIETSHNKTINFNEDELREAVRDIISQEIDLSKYNYKTSEEMWSSRWLWCVNGSHNNNLSKHEERWKINTSERMFRRSALENINFNPIDSFSGTVYVGSSFKKEIGKSGRIIASCDTQSYIAFQHLLDPIERSWKGDRVLLSPGDLGTAAMSELLRDFKDGYNVMLDYDEFDIQHTILAQQIVIEETCKYVDFPPEYSKKLISSFSKMLIHCKGEVLGYSKYSLMTGHRGTTFINSVLNAAYIRMCTGRKLWFELESKHTGDDVVAVFPNLEDISNLIDKFKFHNIRMNPFKQSIGRRTKEFLRIAISPLHSIGYFCRSLGRAVAGNWETPGQLNPEEFLNMWIGTIRTLSNRSNSELLNGVFVESMNKNTRIGKKICKSFLDGTRNLSGGPIFKSFGTWEGYRIIEKHLEKRLKNTHTIIKQSLNKFDYKQYATRDYLETHCSNIETMVYSELGLSPIEYMLNASYAKNQFVKDLTDKVCDIRLGREKSHVIKGWKIYEEYLKKRKYENRSDTLFVHYPLLHFIKKNMTYDLIYRIWKGSKLSLKVLHNTYDEMDESSKLGNYIEGSLSYSDSASIPKLGTLIHVLRPCLV